MTISTPLRACRLDVEFARKLINLLIINNLYKHFSVSI